MNHVTIDPLRYFSNEISLQILSNFSPEQLAIISSVSKLWNGLCNDGSLWKNLTLKNFCNVSQNAEQISWKELFKKNITQIRNIVPRTIPYCTPYVDYETGFYFTINRSIFFSKSSFNNPFDDKSRTKYETGHQKVITCMKLLDTIHSILPPSLITASEDATIKIFSTATLNREQTFIGHTEPITCLKLLTVDPMQFKGSLALLFSGSLDGTVRIWQVPRGTDCPILKDCQILKEEPSEGESSQSCFDGISAIEATEEGYYNYAIFSGSVTGKIIIWDINYCPGRYSKECKTDFKKISKVSDAHEAKITAIKAITKTFGLSNIFSKKTGEIIATASLDKTIKIWFYQWKYNYTKRIWEDAKKVWEVPKEVRMDCIQVIDAGAPITHLELQGFALVSAAMDGSIKLWGLDDLNEFELLQEADLIKEEILDLRSYQHQIIDPKGIRNSILSIIFVVNRSNVFFVGSTGYTYDITPTIPKLLSFQDKAIQ